MRRLLVLAAFALTVAAAGCSSDPLPQGDPVRGESVADNAEPACSVCHTLAAAEWEGETAPDLDNLSLGYERIYNAISNGPGAMPAYRDQLSEQEMQDVAAFVSAEAER